MHPGACWDRSVISMFELVVACPLVDRADTAVEFGVELFYVFLLLKSACTLYLRDFLLPLVLILA